MSFPLPLITVSGTPAECGAAYGVAAAQLIGANVALYLRRFQDQAGLDAAAVRAAGAGYREATRAHHPRIAEMLDGVAEGAGARPEELYALNARTELIYGTRRDGGCTAAGVLDTHTANGHTLLGQNWDWHPDQREAMVVLQTRDERGHAVITLAEAGMLAKTGLNSAGLGLCLNLLGCERDGTRAGGVPYHVLLRAVLETDYLGAALKVACRTPRNASVNLLLGQAHEADGGEIIDVELVPGDAGWLHPVDGVLTHANHLETALPVHDVAKDLGGASLFRGARTRRLLAEAAAARKVTEADLAAAFRDHAGFPMAICRHLDRRDPPLERSETVYSVLLDLDERRFGIAPGPPCQHEYTFLTLP
ncbi:C45 family peptidase [Actinomycetes bacterium KLBMP 9797]